MKMDYPSTTQALFALIVMIIVLVFILVYCCWGTFTCPQTEAINAGGENTREEPTQGRDSPSTPAFVILPYHSMIYIGDGQTQQIYQLPVHNDKPPSYKDICAKLPSPPAYDSYSTISGSEAPPPAYEECVPSRDDITLSDPSYNPLDSRNSSPSMYNSAQRRSQAEVILSPHLLRRPDPNVFRAKSLLTIIPSSQSLVSSHAPINPPRIIPTISVLSLGSHLTSSSTLSHSISQTSSSYTSTSNPCLTCNSNSPPNILKSKEHN